MIPTVSSTAKSDESDDVLCTIPQKMRRVDWRWAAAKGFLNKETNQWNEEMGGQEAYLKQRNDRMMARFGQESEKIVPTLERSSFFCAGKKNHCAHRTMFDQQALRSVPWMTIHELQMAKTCDTLL